MGISCQFKRRCGINWLPLLAIWFASVLSANQISAQVSLDWETKSVPKPRYDFPAVVFHDKIWILGGNIAGHGNHDIWNTDDGRNWNLITPNAAFSRRVGHSAVVFGDKIWVVGGYGDGEFKNDIWCSEDGRVWRQVKEDAQFSSAFRLPLLEFNDKLWLIGPEIWWSEDGVDWQVAATDIGFGDRFHTISATVAFGKLWVIENSSRKVWWSDNGQSWTLATDDPAFSARSDPRCIHFAGKMWLMGGNENFESNGDGLYWSVDGIAWNRVDVVEGVGNCNGFATVVFQGKVWILFGMKDYVYADPDVYSTSDLLVWEQRNAPIDPIFTDRHGLRCEVFKDKIWLVGGGAEGIWPAPYGFNDVWVSNNGNSWEEVLGDAPFSGRAFHSLTAFRDKIWVIGGLIGNGELEQIYANDVWFSENGTSWTQVARESPFSGRSQHTVVGFNQKLWLIGGEDASGLLNDVWCTEDGNEWQLVTGSAEFSPRSGHVVVVHNGQMWVMGGKDNTGFRNDVWSSVDGETWHQINQSTAFLPRSDFAATDCNGMAWIVGGLSQQGQLNDAWWSIDGIKWTRAESKNDTFSRSAHQCIYFDERILVLGGYGGIHQEYLNNVSYSDVTIHNWTHNWTNYH